VKRKQEVSRGKAMFVELAENALQVLTEGGVLCLCSCAYFITLDMLVEAVRIAGGKLRKRFAVIGVTYQSPDHPWVPQIPETLYLKCLWVKILPA
jgi:23S rRNA (cytosine1962-C5)-methyltransferase